MFDFTCSERKVVFAVRKRMLPYFPLHRLLIILYNDFQIMKTFCKNLIMRKVVKLFVLTFFICFGLFSNINAQTISANGITAPAITTGSGSLNPDKITGTNVTVTDSGGSSCSSVIYEWESASDRGFTKDVVHDLAATKDYDPGVITKTTYFRRVASVECVSPERSASSTCSGIKFTILP